MKKKMIRGIVMGLIISTLGTGLAGCGAKRSDTADYNVGFGLMAGGAQQDSVDYNMDYKSDSSIFEPQIEAAEMEVGGTVETGSTTVSNTYTNSGQKLIRTKNINAETKEFDQANFTINAKVAELGGYIESSSTRGTGRGYNLRSVNMTIRIPSTNLDAFVQAIEGSVAVLNTSESAKDVTLSYVDMESHVKALRVEQEALMNLLEKAEDLDDIIRIQSQLTTVRYEIESYESSLRALQNKVDYGTVILNLSEVETETPVIEELTFGEEMMLGLRGNLHKIGMGFRNFALWFLVSIPYLVIWAVVILVAIVIVRKIVRKRKNAKGEKISETTSETTSDKTE